MANIPFLNNAYFSSKVGIGTDSPGGVLSVRNPTAGTSAFSLQHSTTSSIFDFQTGIANVTGNALVIKDVANSYDYLTLRDGNVGIGTTSPDAKFEVAGGTSGIRLSNVGDSGAYDSIEMTYNGYNSGTPEMKFRPTQTPGSGIVNSYFRFINSNGSSTTANNNANVSIDGSLGIGTDSPDVKLQIINSDTTQNILSLSNQNDKNTAFDFGRVVNTGALSIQGRQTGYNNILLAPTSGDVGIGTESPTAKLNVIGDLHLGDYVNTSNKILELRTPSNILSINTSATAAAGTRITYSWANGGQGPLEFYNAGGSVMKLDGNGYVGIGATSPTVKLNVLNGTGAGTANGTASIKVGGFSNYDSLEFGIVNNYDGMIRTYGNDLAIYAGHWRTVGNEASEDHQIKWHTSKSGSADWSIPKMYLDHYGFLGLGTESPQNKLQIFGSNMPAVTDPASTETMISMIRDGSSTVWRGGASFSVGRWKTGGGSAPFSRLDINLKTTTDNSTLPAFTAMSLLDNGYVGIGTTIPGTGLVLSGGDNIASTLTLTNTANGNSWALTPQYNSTNLSIVGPGGVGIGNTDPGAYKLNVTGNTLAQGLSSTNYRVNAAQKYPVGHYSSGEVVWEMDSTWSPTQLADYFGQPATSVYWTNVADAPGGSCLYINGSVNAGGAMNSGFPFIPVETDSEPGDYYMECWIQNIGSNQGHYMGGNEFNENFGSTGGNPGSYAYFTMSNTNPGNSWTKVTGYIGGFDASQTGRFEIATKYWTPMALFNYTAGTGTRACRISGWKIIKTQRSTANYNFRGSVGIGVTTPTSSLHVVGSATPGNYAANITNGSGGGNVLKLYNHDWDVSDHLIHATNGGTASLGYSFVVDGNGRVGIGTISPDAALTVKTAGQAGYARISSDGNGPVYSGNGDNQFYTNNTVYSTSFYSANKGSVLMRIQDSGNVSIGSTNNTYKLDVTGTIRATGDVIAYSDARVKDNVVTIENALDKVTKLRGVSYTRNDVEDKTTKIGVIAQEVLEVLPEVVQQDDEGKYSVAYGNMVGLLIESIKELKAEVDELKSRL